MAEGVLELINFLGEGEKPLIHVLSEPSGADWDLVDTQGRVWVTAPTTTPSLIILNFETFGSPVTFRFRKTGYKDYQMEVTKAESEGWECNVRATLDPITQASIYITSVPTGAAIWADGKDLGVTTNFTWFADPGYHEITVKLDGYEDMTTTGFFAPGYWEPATLILKEIEVPPEVPWYEDLEAAAVFLATSTQSVINIGLETLLRLPEGETILEAIGMYGFDKLVAEAPEYEVLRDSPKGSVSIAVIIGLVSLILGIGTVVGWLRKEAPEPSGMAVWAAIEAREWEAANTANQVYRTFVEAMNTWLPVVVSWFNPFLAAFLDTNRDSQIAQADAYQVIIDAALVVKQGTLIVMSNIDASDVYVNGNKVGLTPFERVYNVGTYNILVTKFRHTSYQITVIIEADALIQVAAVIEPLPEPEPDKATLDIMVTPTDALLEVAGHPEITKMGTYDVDEGVYIIKASKEGYYDKSVTVYASAGEIEEVSIILTEVLPTPPEEIGTLIIISEPPDALIEIAGHPEITSPGTYTLPSGSYTIKITKDGYYDKYITAIIKTAQETTISITLAEKPVEPPPEEVIEVPMESLTAPFNAWKYTIKAVDMITKEALHADIYLDGISIEHYTPWSIYLFPDTKYVLQLERWGYKPAFVEINTPSLPT